MDTNPNTFRLDVSEDTLAELNTLVMAGYIKDGQDIDQDLLDVLVNTSQDEELINSEDNQNE